MTSDHPSLKILGRLGRLLDEAVDIADGAGETLLAAQIAQTLFQLDARIVELHADPMVRAHRPVVPPRLEE